MLIGFLLGLVADALLGSPASIGRQFERELNAFLQHRDLPLPEDERKPTPA
jgi:hypothetical protein